MTSYRNKYLEMLKTDLAKAPTKEPPKLTKAPWSLVSFVSSQDRPVSDFSPPYDAEGVPCGVCPTCHRGEFWRYPNFHQDHDPRGWVCWFCSPPPEGSGPCDFCGVPEDNK
jgi:hypothetical protein